MLNKRGDSGPLQRRRRAKLASLTRRESEVLAWLAQGLSNAELGAAMSLSPRTIQKHLERIYSKLGVRNRTEATVFKVTVDFLGKDKAE